MKVPVSWLREFVEFDLSVEELARRLVFTSCEVDRVVRRGVHDSDGNLGLFRVGRVLEAEKHPNADRLRDRWREFPLSPGSTRRHWSGRTHRPSSG